MASNALDADVESIIKLLKKRKQDTIKRVSTVQRDTIKGLSARLSAIKGNKKLELSKVPLLSEIEAMIQTLANNENSPLAMIQAEKNNMAKLKTALTGSPEEPAAAHNELTEIDDFVEACLQSLHTGAEGAHSSVTIQRRANSHVRPRQVRIPAGQRSCLSPPG